MVPQTAHVKIVVYDIIGKEVATLINDRLNAGGYKVEWNANNMGSGVYICKLFSNNFVQSRKMILIK